MSWLLGRFVWAFMAWTCSPYPCLKLWGQQLTKNRKKENYKHVSLLFSGYKHQQLKGKASSSKCSLFTHGIRPFRNFKASKSGYQLILCSLVTSCNGLWSTKVVKRSVGKLAGCLSKRIFLVSRCDESCDIQTMMIMIGSPICGQASDCSADSKSFPRRSWAT